MGFCAGREMVRPAGLGEENAYSGSGQREQRAELRGKRHVDRGWEG